MTLGRIHSNIKQYYIECCYLKDCAIGIASLNIV